MYRRGLRSMEVMPVQPSRNPFGMVVMYLKGARSRDNRPLHPRKTETGDVLY